MYGAFLREMSDLVKIKIALENPLLELVGDLDRLGVVPDGGIHDGNALGTGVSPATGGRRSGEAGDGASLSTGTHVVGPIEALCWHRTRTTLHILEGTSTKADSASKGTAVASCGRRRFVVDCRLVERADVGAGNTLTSHSSRHGRALVGGSTHIEGADRKTTTAGFGGCCCDGSLSGRAGARRLGRAAAAAKHVGECLTDEG